MQDYLEIGQIVNTFGIKGFVKVNPFTDDVTRFEILKKVCLEKKDTSKEYTIEEVKYQKNVVLLKFKGIDTIEQAELLRNSFLKIPRSEAIELQEDTYFIVDLIGLKVYKEENDQYIGVLEDITSTKNNDVYYVKTEEGKLLLLPATKEVIKKVDIPNGKMLVHIIEGLE